MNVKKVIFSLFAALITMFQASAVAPSITKKDFSNAARQAAGNADTKYEQARNIYNWITSNITYFYDAKRPVSTAEKALENMRGDDLAFCDLFWHLANPLGIKCEIVNGMARYLDKHVVKDHAWLIVETERGPIIVDPMWGAGMHKANNMFVRYSKTDKHWFDADPYYAIFTHFPDSASMQLITPPVDSVRFVTMPIVYPKYADYGIEGKTLFDAAMKNQCHLPVVARYDSKVFDLVNIPPLEELRIGQYQEFHVKAHKPCAFAISIDGYLARQKWTAGPDSITVIRYMPKKSGELQLLLDEGETYSLVATYQVPEATEADLKSIEDTEPYASHVFDHLKRINIDVLDQIGVDPQKLLAEVRAGRITESVAAFYAANADCYKVVDVPLNFTLKAGEPVTFVLRPMGDYKWATINNGKWNRKWQKNDDGTISITVTPEAGDFSINVLRDPNAETYPYCIRYEVK